MSEAVNNIDKIKSEEGTGNGCGGMTNTKVNFRTLISRHDRYDHERGGGDNISSSGRGRT